MVCLLIILFITGFLHAEWYYTEIADLNATPERAVFYENKIFVGTDNGEIYKISPERFIKSHLLPRTRSLQKWQKLVHL